MFLDVLKNNGEDFEWYPTTDEIFECLNKDMVKTFSGDDWKWNAHEISYNTSYRDDENDRIHISSFLDVGTGDGRIFEKLTGNTKTDIVIGEKLGIEKATLHCDNLIRKGIWMLGRDFMETVLVDKKFSIIFSNPPYRNYEDWCKKLLTEASAKFIYLVIPDRWEENVFLRSLVAEQGEYEVLGEFDFLDADRPARCKTHLVKINCSKEHDLFKKWVEENIGSFKVNEPVILEEEEKEEEKPANEVSRRLSDIESLVTGYNEDLEHLLDNFRKIGEIDFEIIKQLGVNKDDVIKKIKGDITELKIKYWGRAFDTLSAINSRLTCTTREKLINEIKWFNKLDFNEGNIYSVIIWVVENFNKHTKDQLLDAFNGLTDFENVRAYKSNDKWIKDNWRYTKPVPTKYSLDYRVVTSAGYKLRCCNEYSYENPANNLIVDLSIVAASLGYLNGGVEAPEIGKKLYCYKHDGSVLFEYKVFKNQNVHFKLDQEFLKDLNIEAGKLHGWLKNPDDIQKEFELSQEEALKYFKNSSLQLITDGTMLLTA